jgi:hypothetical protein
VEEKKKRPEKISTKTCPKCGNENLGLFTSLNKKYCASKECHFYFDWYLDPGQEKIFK